MKAHKELAGREGPGQQRQGKAELFAQASVKKRSDDATIREAKQDVQEAMEAKASLDFETFFNSSRLPWDLWSALLYQAGVVLWVVKFTAASCQGNPQDVQKVKLVSRSSFGADLAPEWLLWW